MKMNRRWSFLAVSALSAALAVPALGMGMGPTPDAHRPIDALLRCLSMVGLSDTQKTDIKAYLEAQKPAMQALVDKLKTDGEALKSALEKNPADPCAVGTALLAVRNDGKALKDEGAKVFAGVEALLTAEQKAKLEGCLAGMHHGNEPAEGSLESFLDE